MVLIGLGWAEKKYLPHGGDQQNGVPAQEWLGVDEGRRATDRRGRPSRSTSETPVVTPPAGNTPPRGERSQQ
jgi:hypothetical protein